MIENGLLTKLNKDLIPNIEHMDPAFLGRALGPDERVLDLQGVGHDRFRLRQDRDHARAEDLERLPRRRAERGERQDGAARRPGRDHRHLLLGERHRLEHRRTPPTSTRARSTSSNSSPRTSPAFDSYPGAQRDPAGHAGADAGRGTATRAWASSRVPRPRRAGSGCSARPTPSCGWTTGRSPTGAPHPEAAHAFINFVAGARELARRARLHRLQHRREGHRRRRPRRGPRDARHRLLHARAARDDARAARSTRPRSARVDIWNKVKAAAGA